MPLLADPTFAQFSHEIGLAAIGASEEDIKNLATVCFYFYQVKICLFFFLIALKNSAIFLQLSLVYVDKMEN